MILVDVGIEIDVPVAALHHPVDSVIDYQLVWTDNNVAAVGCDLKMIQCRQRDSLKAESEAQEEVSACVASFLVAEAAGSHPLLS